MQLIVAVDANWAIGYKNKLLVRLPDDQRFFREMTMGHVIVMGHKTLMEFPNGLPLQGRKNIILSRNQELKIPNAVVVHSKQELLKELDSYDSDDVFIIGGESIYEMMYEYCDAAHVTKINYSYQADCFFPNLDELDNWVITGESDEQTYFDLEYYFYKYQNRNPKKLSD